jgi:hypothetical protein
MFTLFFEEDVVPPRESKHIPLAIAIPTKCFFIPIPMGTGNMIDMISVGSWP